MRYITDEGSIVYGGDNHYIAEGSVLLTPEEASHLAFNVMPSYASNMLDNAKQMREQAAAIEAAPVPKPEPGKISLLPHPNALRTLAVQFDNQFNDAQGFAASLQGPE